jgi:hypothetical protein
MSFLKVCSRFVALGDHHLIVADDNESEFSCARSWERINIIMISNMCFIRTPRGQGADVTRITAMTRHLSFGAVFRKCGTARRTWLT